MILFKIAGASFIIAYGLFLYMFVYIAVYWLVNSGKG
jgi:hypothetical protein